MESRTIEKELEEFLGTRTEELKEKIIKKAIWLRKDHSKMVVLRIFAGGSYDVVIGQEGSYDGFSDGERFWVSFSLIEPWDLPEYESVIEGEDGNGYIDQDNGDEFEDDDELLEAVQGTVSSGFYHKFEGEWKKFLKGFDEWYEEKRVNER